MVLVAECGRTYGERENSELYYTGIKILGSCLFFVCVCVCVCGGGGG